jgi:hypothetical protein
MEMRLRFWKTKKVATEHDEFSCLNCGGNTRSELVQEIAFIHKEGKKWRSRTF